MNSAQVAWMFMAIWLGVGLATFAIAKLAERRWEQHVDEAMAAIEEPYPEERDEGAR